MWARCCYLVPITISHYRSKNNILISVVGSSPSGKSALYHCRRWLVPRLGPCTALWYCISRNHAVCRPDPSTSDETRSNQGFVHVDALTEAETTVQLSEAVIAFLAKVYWAPLRSPSGIRARGGEKQIRGELCAVSTRQSANAGTMLSAPGCC